MTAHEKRQEPPYLRIVAELRDAIEAGGLPPGTRVPSTRDITRRWGVAMATATKVLTELKRQGLVRTLPGVGTVVADGGRRPGATPGEHGSRAAGGTPGAARTGPHRGTDRRAATRTGAPPAGRSTAPAVGTPPAVGVAPGDGAASDQRRARHSSEETAPGPLTLEVIVDAAVRIADAEGLDAVSMRRVAADLSAATMSLYRHVADKDDLLLRMMDAVFAGAPLPPAPDPATGPDAWREGLERVSRTLWALFRRHPWLASAMSLTRPQAIPHAIRFTERVLASLQGRGLDTATVFTIHLALFNYTRGSAVAIEAEAEAEATTGMDSEEWLKGQEGRLRAALDTADVPVFRRMMAEGYDFDLDALHEFGLQRLLDGIAPLMGAVGHP